MISISRIKAHILESLNEEERNILYFYRIKGRISLEDIQTYAYVELLLFYNKILCFTDKSSTPTILMRNCLNSFMKGPDRAKFNYLIRVGIIEEVAGEYKVHSSILRCSYDEREIHKDIEKIIRSSVA